MGRIAPLAVILVAASCSGGGLPGEGDVGVGGAAIIGGVVATSYPEAVVVTSSGFIPCSGVLLAPRVVLSAGHCRSTKHEYTVVAPNAPNAPNAPDATAQTATGTADWSTFGGEAATSSDTLLIFLDTPISLESYPTIPESTAAPGTKVVDVGRTLNGTITSDDYASPVVTILGPGTTLGFPDNYEAQPDISQDGDSGGPIELSGVTPHQVVAIVDTDTVEQNLSTDGGAPIDLFARLDVVRAEILEQVAMHDSVDAAANEAGARDAETHDESSVTDAAHRDGRADNHDASPTPAPTHGSGGCAVRPMDDGASSPAALCACALVLLPRRRRRFRAR